MTNQEFLTEYILKDIVQYLIKDEALNIQEALRFIYNSDTYSKLIDATTDLYTQSSGYVYELLRAEYHLGKLPLKDETFD